MKRCVAGVFAATLALGGACSAEPPAADTFDEYEELGADTILVAPEPAPGRYAPAEQDQVERGRYLVELLACGVCHTDGALAGAANMALNLAGSRTGIAYTSPLQVELPGVIYPPNITPDDETGIGRWSDRQIAEAITAGLGRDVKRRILSMPWQGYAKLSEEDTRAIVVYLRSIEPIRHRVPNDVEPGQKATEPFVYFGVYRSR